MFKSFRVGSVLGIPLRLDITFLLILPVFAYLIGSEIELLIEALDPLSPGAVDPGAMTGGVTPWALGFAAAIGLFTSVALHELGHSVVARRYGYPISSITLWLLGGIAQLAEMPRRWSHEFAIAVAGPAVSVAVGVAALVPLVVLDGPPVVVFLLAYLGVMNIALAAFNLLPAFPMDGGRVLRSLLARKRSLPRATKLAAEVGKAFAVLMGLWGLFVFNPILIAVALFIYIAASGEAKRVLMEEALSGVRVEDVMTPIDELRMVSSRTTVTELLQRMFQERVTGYPVVRNGRPIGVVTLADAQRVAEVERDAMEVRDVMTQGVWSIGLSSDLYEALGRMRSAGTDRVLVVDTDGDLAGLLSQTDVSRLFDLVRHSDEWNVGHHRPEANRD